MPQWIWIGLGGMAIAVLVEELRVYWVRHEAAQKEEIFQVVTENAADMIALVDVKGRRLTTADPTKDIRPRNSAGHHHSNRFILTTE